ncbi:MAG TPA: Rid family detoxifying hydrolase [Sphaerochaeta sp.]|jgi:2-iminobutanoate/2-iminopropanoate deaminase|nr:Rid family detoxifying hydrolase [Sphaerochaeta sp.]HPB42158.1 Rid family detoxifying hydrolase [Sphaerochaeta sp.]HPY46070.1 Rid family detoxifying hydrolase [Sphaerochaeta sp.]HQB05896.1 Rid family detoxifying hydrolase [Sphaerochaeta sp.]
MSLQVTKSEVATPNAPKAIGPYSQAVSAGPFVFTSGVLPVDPKTGKLVEGGIVEHTKQVFENLKAILKEAGTSLSNAVKTTVFIASMKDFAAMNEVYASYLGDGVKPSRSTVEIPNLALGALVEIEMIVLQ